MHARDFTTTTGPASLPANPMIAIGMMALGFLLFSISDAASKLMTGDFHPLQVAWTRQLGLLSVGLWLLARRGPAIFRTRRPKLQLARGTVAALSSSMFIFAVSYVPLAEAIAIAFVAPFVVTIFGALILKEPVGARRWIAVVIGFVGMLIVVRPGYASFHPAMFLVLASAALFSARQILSRMVGPVDMTSTTILYSSLTAISLLSVPAILVWSTPTTLGQCGALLCVAASAGMGEVLIIRALERAHAVVLAPVQYTLIVWGTIWGWMLFAQFPDHWTLVGTSIIIASGLYTLHREHKAARSAPKPEEVV
ncbi:DMT family transporter [Salipiger sp.]|uniref:DMT family transporter n=1 Tax=Salipiger sp. TaxID=2078585 RepID=UPI003A96C1F2